MKLNEVGFGLELIFVINCIELAPQKRVAKRYVTLSGRYTILCVSCVAGKEFVSF